MGPSSPPTKTQYGLNIHEAKLPSQSHFESFEERQHNGVIEAETLAHEGARWRWEAMYYQYRGHFRRRLRLVLLVMRCRIVWTDHSKKFQADQPQRGINLLLIISTLKLGGGHCPASLITFFVLCATAGIPLSWGKVSGSDVVTWVGFDPTSSEFLNEERSGSSTGPGRSQIILQSLFALSKKDSAG